MARILPISLVVRSGSKYDKARFFEKKAKYSENSYKQLIDSLPESLPIGATSLIVTKEQKSIIITAEDYAYNQGFTIWGD